MILGGKVRTVIHELSWGKHCSPKHHLQVSSGQRGKRFLDRLIVKGRCPKAPPSLLCLPMQESITFIGTQSYQDPENNVNIHTQLYFQTRGAGTQRELRTLLGACSAICLSLWPQKVMRQWPWGWLPSGGTHIRKVNYAIPQKSEAKGQ